MDDLDKMARELLAQANERLGLKSTPGRIREGDMDAHKREFCSAIRAALLTAPSGYALVPAEPTTEMLRAVYPYHWRILGDDFREQWARAIAAAPEPK